MPPVLVRYMKDLYVTKLIHISNLLARVLRKGFSVGDCSLFTLLTSKELLQRFEML